ncbi:hypothetical protein [Pseudomonas sp. PSKL.D1]|uniref:hypothetical protein n=1 Tax=Pseudomonas sp. PSKL.D1 TaxID=3029060 RepID=UPI0023813934|nr:hypothetical protein [Pseudomonas sp. PSKL.D1]WDY60237.1 hypothetical protein PVV54_11615 [Pseudomonas sp. PSKL.D1]
MSDIDTVLVLPAPTIQATTTGTITAAQVPDGLLVTIPTRATKEESQLEKVILVLGDYIAVEVYAYGSKVCQELKLTLPFELLCGIWNEKRSEADSVVSMNVEYIVFQYDNIVGISSAQPIQVNMSLSGDEERYVDNPLGSQLPPAVLISHGLGKNFISDCNVREGVTVFIPMFNAEGKPLFKFGDIIRIYYEGDFLEYEFMGETHSIDSYQPDAWEQPQGYFVNEQNYISYGNDIVKDDERLIKYDAHLQGVPTLRIVLDSDYISGSRSGENHLSYQLVTGMETQPDDILDSPKTKVYVGHRTLVFDDDSAV